MMNSNEANQIPIAPEHCVTGFGTTLIVAPHADDESLGCGGLISLLRKYGQQVFILLLSDGSLSHPNSKEYPAEKLMELREQELLNAASILGVDSKNIICCRYKDRSVPQKDGEEFESAVTNISKLINSINPQSIFVPWRRDPHPDHRAAYQLISEANTRVAKIYEYPIWLQGLGEEADFPIQGEIIPFRLDITTVLELKKKALSMHRSQYSDLITDDEHGFKLSPEMIAQFSKSDELFYMSK